MEHLSKSARLWIGGIVAGGMLALAPAGALAAGGWSIVTSPNASGVPSSDLSSVACANGNECWAVGFTSVTNVFADNQTLIERWNGHTWVVVASPNATANDSLLAATCKSEKDCWAVGIASNGTNNQTLIEHWNGAFWSIVSSPNAGTGDNILDGVACSSSNDCWAVGYSGTPAQTLAEHWNGGSWTIVSSPSPVVGQDNILASVSCAAPTSCWAVGYAGPVGSNLALTLIEHWNGETWTALSNSPNPSPTDDLLVGVTCQSDSSCWAVGSQGGVGGLQTLTERWDGHSWTAVSSANTTPLMQNIFYDVACASAHNCWAVGIYQSAATQTLTEHWDGTSWTIALSQNTSSAENNYLFGATCTSGAVCWSVGNSTDGAGFDHTLVETTS